MQVGIGQGQGVVRVGPRPNRGPLDQPPKLAGAAEGGHAHEHAPFVAPPAVAFQKFGHEQFVEQDLSVGRHALSSSPPPLVRQLGAEQGVVRGAEAVFPGAKRRHGDEVVRFDSALKRRIVAPPFHRAKQRAAPASAEGHFGPLGGEPPRVDGVGLHVPGPNQRLGILHNAGVHPQPRAEGGGHVPVQKQRARPSSPMVALLPDTHRDRRGQGPGQGTFESVDRGHGFIQQHGIPQPVHAPVVGHFPCEGKAQRNPPARGGDMVAAALQEGSRGAQANRRAGRTEITHDLTRFAHHGKAFKGTDLRLQGRGTVP